MCQKGHLYLALAAAFVLMVAPQSYAVTFTATSIPADFPFRVASAHSGLCWDVPSGNYTVGAVVQQYPCGTGNNQNWNFLFATTGNRLLGRIRSVGNSAYCIARSSTNRLVLDSCATPLPTSSLDWFVNLRTAGFYAAEISGVRFSGCIDVPISAATNSGLAPVALQTFACNGNYNQSWLLQPSR